MTASKITSKKVREVYAKNILNNYGAAPFALVRGEGSFVWDAEQRRYLDFTSGIAVNTLGHGHPHWVERISNQTRELVHVSNLFHVPQQAVLAQKLCEKVGPGRMFFCNSGAEANEFLIKLARLHGRNKTGEEGQCFRVVTARNAFHGRTFGGMAATPQAKIQKGFGPMLDGFRHAVLNDVQSFAEQLDDSVCAILLETIQGEGGIYPAQKQFLKDIRQLCRERDILFLLDEVQCGIGRTGRFFAFEHAGIMPDAIGMAKGLGGGFPIGAAWVAEPYSQLFQPGSHGTTYGGNPLACTAALAVLEVLEDEGLVERVDKLGKGFIAQLNRLSGIHKDRISGVRGLGFHVALVVNDDPNFWVEKLRENGLLTVRAGTDAIRLMPPLTVSEQEIQTAIEIIDFVFGTHSL